MKKLFPLLFLCFCFNPFVFGQMWNGQDTLYGNEWINYSNDYYKIKVTEDGIYRISFQELQNAGVPASSINGSEYSLMYMGVEVPIFTTTNNSFSSGDFIEFYGKKNRTDLDRYLFIDPDNEMLNPEYSLFTDTSAYFLTWSAGTTNQRIQSVSNALNNLPTAEPYYLHKEVNSLTELVIQEADIHSVAVSSFKYVEGFSSRFRRTSTIVVSTSSIYTGVAKSDLKIRLATSIADHNLEVKWNGAVIVDEEVNGFTMQEYDRELNTADIKANNNVRIRGLIGAQDRLSPTLINLTYPRLFDFNDESNFHFDLPQSTDKKYIEITNFNAGNEDPIVYDFANNKRLIAAYDAAASVVRLALPPETNPRQLCIASPGEGVKMVTGLERMNFVDLNSSEADYVIISHPALYDDGNGQNWVQEYANYRQSLIGGGYTPTIIDIHQLYDQFSYGVERTPISIRNFGHFIEKKWPNTKYFFIIGKAREYPFARTNEDLALAINQSYFVPTFGMPGSDNLLLSNNYSSIPIFAIGRLAASTPNDVKVYLEKMQTLESNNNLPQTYVDRAWQKRILHLSGGDPTIQVPIAGYLKTMEEVIENNKFGAEVTTFYKTSTDPVQISESEEIFDLINNGVSILTFFGHSGVGTFDFNIDNPDNYFNYGKYPLMFSLGCFSGNIHTSAIGISERFLFYEDKGAISFIASTGQGYISVLRRFAERYYSLVGDEMYGEGIGDVMKRTIETFDVEKSRTVETLHQQFTLHGDPAMRLNPRPGPDYVVDASTVSFEPATVSSVLDSFSINFEVSNIGRNTPDSFFIKIEQKLPAGDEVTLILDKIEAPGFGNKLSYKVPNFGVIASGQNRIFITVDVESEVDELPSPIAEMNNELYSGNGLKGISLFITDNSAKTIYPEEFAIISTPKVSLKSSSRNTMVGEQMYVYQIDTTELFNSPALQSKELTQIGGVIEWEPSLNLENGRVYYWRISPDSMNTEVGYVWNTSSFIYLEGETEGWNQSHYYQYKKDQFEGMGVEQGETFDFWVNGIFYTVKNKVKEPNANPEFNYNFDTPANSVRPWDYTDSGMAVFVGDSITGLGWENPPGGAYGTINPVNKTTRAFAFPTSTTEERKAFIDFLDNVVQKNNFVFIFSFLDDATADFYPETWAQDSVTTGTNIFQYLESQGATLSRGLESLGSVPYTFIYKKGVEVLSEKIAPTKGETLISEVFLPVLRDEGNIITEKIGPASNWEELSWDYEYFDPLEDTVSVSVFGVDNENNEVLLVMPTMEKEVALNTIDPAVYPYLKLEYKSKDILNRTSPNLKFWRVNYKGIPESAINPNQILQVYNDTLQEGEMFVFETAIENIGNYNMDSLLVKYTITDNTNSSEVKTERLAPLLKDNSLETTYSFPTRGLNGPVNFSMEVNPDEDQPEQYQFNNFANYQFLVKSDERNPLLDVTFDGTHIMDGDIVSAKPEILIALKDENPFLRLEDTALVKVYLTDPLGEQRQFYFSSDTATFYPPSNAKNRALIEINPVLKMDGMYELIVQAQDVTGNQSGDIDYKINFEVITKKSISNILNYPNPFSTSTQFVYTLTGDETPHHFKIQILTVSGKIVREITEQELGPLKVGTHRTDYTWDGTDEYGQRLANGVYLYRVVAKNIDGEDFEKYETNTTQFFKNDFGKMVILR